MTEYSYASRIYTSLENVEAAVTAMKQRLDNNPTDWCVVKPMINPRTIAIYSGNVIGYDSGDALTDTQINALSSSSTVYNVYSIHEGDNFTEVAEADVAGKVRNMRRDYARRFNVDKYINFDKEQTLNVTNEDMSGYV
jgi:hypothetical protein|tara:strand:+ start:129 stop:542 length:414 start_codon:yes stop_codon:yes gene_type:complete